MEMTSLEFKTVDGSRYLSATFADGHTSLVLVDDDIDNALNELLSAGQVMTTRKDTTSHKTSDGHAHMATGNDTNHTCRTAHAINADQVWKGKGLYSIYVNDGPLSDASTDDGLTYWFGSENQLRRLLEDMCRHGVTATVKKPYGISFDGAGRYVVGDYYDDESEFVTDMVSSLEELEHEAMLASGTDEDDTPKDYDELCSMAEHGPFVSTYSDKLRADDDTCDYVSELLRRQHLTY